MDTKKAFFIIILVDGTVETNPLDWETEGEANQSLNTVLWIAYTWNLDCGSERVDSFSL